MVGGWGYNELSDDLESLISGKKSTKELGK